jgi:hypothetical protein
MKRAMLWAAVAIAAALPADEGAAALFSSTQLFNSSQNSFVRAQTRIHNSTQNPALDSVQAGINDVTLTVDTDADTGTVADVDFKSITGMSRTATQSVNVNTTVIVTPANFPLPAVTRQVQGNYRSILTITSVTDGTTPQFASSNTAPIVATSTPPIFQMRNNIALTLGGFTVNGTYQAIGPTQNTTVPFSVAYLPVSPTQPRQFLSRITGGANFGDGFGFNAGMNSIAFVPTTTLIFDGVLDDITFHAELDDMTVTFLPTGTIPEPTSLSLGAAGWLAVLAASRRRRR